MKKPVLLGLQILLGIALYCLFSLVLYLGLQVNATFGSIGVLMLIPCIGLYIYWLIRCRKNR